MTLPPPIERTNVVPFRRGGQRVRYRRRHPVRKLLLPFLGAVVIVGLPLWSVTWLWTTPRLALDEIRIDRGIAALDVGEPRAAASRVPSQWVREALAPLRGRNLLRLRLEDAEGRLDVHPWVKSVRLRKELPDRLRVEVLEHRAVALLHEDDALVYLDAHGHLIAPMRPEDGEVDLMLIRRAAVVASDAGDPAEESTELLADLEGALALAGEIRSTQQAWSSGLSEIEVLGEQDFRLITSELPFPLLVRAGTLEERVRRLEALVPQIIARYGRVAAVDLRFARRIIVEPFARPAAAGIHS